MADYRVLVDGDVLPASFVEALQQFIGTATATFHLEVVPPSPPTGNPIAVQVVAGINSAQSGIGIDGLWRYISATINTTVTGAAGVYDIFVTCGPNDFVGTPPDTDLTNYAFALQSVAHGSTPTTGSGLTNYRKVGEVDWSGSAITGIRQLEGNFRSTEPMTPTSPGPTIAASRAIGAPDQTAPIATVETSGGGILTKVGPTAPAPGDNSAQVVTTAYLLAALAALPSNTKIGHQAHAATTDDQTPPNAAASVIGSFPIYPASGETVVLIGVAIHCITHGSTPSVFKIQTDNASHGAMADVAGLTGLTPNIGSFVWVPATTPLTMAGLDRISVVVTTPGNSLGCTIAVVTEHTS